jgi:ParB-like nuclease domain
VLAAALAQKRHWWLGPIRVRLDDLVRLAGPEEEALVRVAPDVWEGDVEEMQESLEQGWEPPPLLAEYQDGRLLLQDGNHRYEALVRAREREAWVLVYFDDPVERDGFRAGERGRGRAGR